MISVCLTTYNGEKHISEQLHSILCQLSDSDEIIISDDGSIDKTLDIIQSYNDDRLKLFLHKKDNNFPNYSFYKITKNVENALIHANGDLIFLADQDDIWIPTKVQSVIHEIGDNLGLLHDCIVVDENENIIQTSYYKQNKSNSGVILNIFNSSYLGCCMVIKRELLAKALPFPSHPVPHDIWLGLIADCMGKMKMIDNKLIKYRRHGANLSTSSEKSQASLLYKFNYRTNIIKALLLRVIFGK